jgi:phosphomannomutase
LAALGETPAGTTLSSLLTAYQRYVPSGEINTTVDDQGAATARIRAAYEGREGVTLDDLDGLTVTGQGWWFNVRPSNTEPLLRLNVEGNDEARMVAARDEALALIRGED